MMVTNGNVASALEQANKRCVGITTPGYKNHDIESEVLRKSGAEVRVLEWLGDRNLLCQMLGDVDVLMVRDLPLLDAEVISHMREGSGNLSLIQYSAQHLVDLGSKAFDAPDSEFFRNHNGGTA